MGIALLVIPIVDRLAFFQLRFKDKVTIPLITCAVRNCTNHWEGEDVKPSLCKLIEPEDGNPGSIVTLLREKITVNKEKWALEWKIEGSNKDEMHYEDARTDQEITMMFFDILRSILKEDSLEVPVGTKLERVRLVLATGEEVDHIKGALSGMDAATIIILEYAKHESWIFDLIGERSWSLLKTTKKSLRDSEAALKLANKSAVDWRRKAESFEQKLNVKEKELKDVETYIWKEGVRVFEKALQTEGYLVPKRRVCKVCQDSESHVEPSVTSEEIDCDENVERHCPLFSEKQRCEQCAQRPPDCYSNDKVMRCKWVETAPCKREHFARIPPHTRSIHSLDHTEDIDFIQMLVTKHGICNFLEYRALVEETVVIDDELI